MSFIYIYKQSKIVISLTAMGLAIAACQPRTENKRSLVSVSATHKMKDCGGTPTISKVFRIFIDDPPIQGPSIKGDVEFEDPQSPGQVNESMEETEDVNPSGSPNSYYMRGKYPFHINLTDKNANLTNGQFVMIRIVLPDATNYKFTDTTDNGEDIYGVGVGEAPSVSNFCKDYPNVYSTGKQVAIFYELVGIPPKGLNPEPFNIVIEGSHTNDTPVIIDPKSHQPGSQ